MRQIRDNIWLVTHGDLGKSMEKGPVDVPGLGTVLLDMADENYIKEYLVKGYEPAFFVSKSPAMVDWFVVVARQRV
jgi:hypothetical protein